jgi:hypothetical protein
MNLIQPAQSEPWNELRLAEQLVRVGAGPLQPEEVT